MSQASQQIARQYANAAINKQQWSFSYNALAEGLVGDGVTDDTAALQALINKAIAEERRTIIFPHGEYYVTALTNADQVDFIGDNSTFVGGYAGTIGNIGGFAELQADIAPYINPQFFNTDRVLYVDGTGGNDSNDGITSGTAKKTIQAALNLIPVEYLGNITIDIAAGTYNELFQSKKVGSAGTVAFQGKKDGSNIPTVIIDGTGLGDNTGIILYGLYGSLTDIKVQNFRKTGIYIESCTFIGLNNVHGYANGILGYETVRSSRSAVIYNGGVIDGNNVSVYGTTAYNGFISVLNVNIKNCSYGAYWADASAGHCDGNTIENCDRGVVAMHGGFVSSFLNNTIKNCTSFGVYADNGGNVIVNYGTTTFTGNGENVRIIQSLGKDGKIWDDTTPLDRTVFECNGNSLDFVTAGAGAFLASIDSIGLRASSSAWNGAHFRIGAYHFWVDATGKLRIKASAPTSDTDGTVVGTQT